MRQRSLILALATLLLFSCTHSRYMTRAYTDIKKSLHEANVMLIKDTVKVVFPNSVLFDFGSATIKPGIHPAFERFASVLNKYGQVDILISGHTDTVGTAEINIALSKRRADSAKALLIYSNVNERRFYTWGMGSRHPVASNESEAGRQQNRRVEFIVLRNHKLEADSSRK